jgi:hypothetical protein
MSQPLRDKTNFSLKSHQLKAKPEEFQAWLLVDLTISNQSFAHTEARRHSNRIFRGCVPPLPQPRQARRAL